MLILASTSPRRKEILRRLGYEFKIVDPHIIEVDSRLHPHELPLDISKQKAYAVFNNYPHDSILACDTVVILNQQIIGKPKDHEDAKRILRLLSGTKHVVLSGYTFISKEKEINRTVRTEVYFRKLSEKEIEDYVLTGSPLDKAGAYGIQDGFDFVEKIVGSFDNVMGFPSEDILKHCFK